MPELISQEEKELKESIDNLEHTVSDANSTKKVIWRGILSGFSGAIGATIIFGLVIALVSWILYVTGVFPQMSEYLSSFSKTQ